MFEYAHELVMGVCDHLAEIDAHIQSAAREWPLNQMARIDKNILRLAIYEILFNNTVPAKAAINEAVELAKQFGSNTSSRFINGVLGRGTIGNWQAEAAAHRSAQRFPPKRIRALPCFS